MKFVTVAIVGLTLACVAGASARTTGGTPVALITAESQNELLAVVLPSGRIIKRISLPADPQNVAAGPTRVAVVVSPRAGAVTLLDSWTLRVVKIFRGFASPHLAAIHPSGTWAYVTDDPRGVLSVIDLQRKQIVDRIHVGLGAHHLTISPDGHRLWIALGEQASAIAIVDLSHPSRPRFLRRFSPGFAAHDLTFSPAGTRVWVTSGVGDLVHVLDARTGKTVLSVRVGTAPQHVVFSGRGYAFITSGYSRRIVMVNPRSGRVLASARTPYGSFNLSSIMGIVVTTSLLNGQVTEFSDNLRRMSSMRPARAARAVALTVM